MHTDYHSDEPGTCPICGMNLVINENSKRDELNDNILGEDFDDNESSQKIHIPLEKQRSIGVKTQKVVKDILKNEFTFPGQVAYDPELYSALVEYRESRKAGSDLATLAQSAKIKLMKLGINDAELKFWTSQDPSILLTGRSKNKVLIFYQIYERDINKIKIGSNIFIEDESDTESISGKVNGIFKLIANESRTAKGWSFVNDPKQLLHPGMFIKIHIPVEYGIRLVVPNDAIINNGTDSIVYKKISDYDFIPEVIKTGLVANEYTEVISGLAEGDEIATGATFFLDSESKMNYRKETNTSKKPDSIPINPMDHSNHSLEGGK
nr:putative Co/Zn/Cd efflux system membrane fusion protein [Leptospira sp. GIMC2001]